MNLLRLSGGELLVRPETMHAISIAPPSPPDATRNVVLPNLLLQLPHTQLHTSIVYVNSYTSGLVCVCLWFITLLLAIIFVTQLA